MLSNSASTCCFTIAKLSRSSALTGNEGGASHVQGIYRLAVFVYTEIEMRTSRETGRTHIGDHFTLLHMTAHLYAFGKLTEMHISGGIYGVVFYFQEISAAILISFGNNGSGSDAFNRVPTGAA